MQLLVLALLSNGAKLISCMYVPFLLYFQMSFLLIALRRLQTLMDGSKAT